MRKWAQLSITGGAIVHFRIFDMPTDAKDRFGINIRKQIRQTHVRLLKTSY